MKKQVFCGVFALALAVTGCGVQKKEAASDIVPENRQELTILHMDADIEGFDSFISQAEKDLGIEIHIVKCQRLDCCLVALAGCVHQFSSCI